MLMIPVACMMSYVRMYAHAMPCTCHAYPESFWPKILIVDRTSVRAVTVPLRVCSAIACALRWSVGEAVLHLRKSDKGICLLRLAIYSRLTLHVTTRRIIVDCIGLDCRR